MEDSEGSLDGRLFSLVAAVGLSTLGKVDGSLIVLTSQAQLPARLFASTFVTAILKNLHAGVITLGVLFWAFVLHALYWVIDRNQGSDFVHAVVVYDALPELVGVFIALLGDTGGPAGLVVLAFVLAGLEDSHAA